MKGIFKGFRCWGRPQQLLATIGCVRGFKGEYKERTLESSAKTLRSPEIKGELSRFKLRREIQEISSYIYVETRRTDQAVFLVEKLRQI